MSEVGLGVAVLALAAVAASRMLVTADEPSVVRLTFPRTVSPEQATAAVRSLAGLLPPWWRRLFGVPTATLELRGSAAGIEHVLTMPSGRAEYVLGALRAAIPGLRVSEADGSGPEPSLTRELRTSGAGRLRTDAAAATNSGILAALHPVAADEQAVVQYVIAPTGRTLLAWLSAEIDSIRSVEPRRPSSNSTEPTFAVAARIGVGAHSKARRGQLMARLLGAFHALNTPDARLTRRLLPSDVVGTRLRRAARSGATGLDAEELAACLGLPLDAPELPVRSNVPRRGLVLRDSTVAGTVRPVAVSRAEATRGIHLCAPTGSGKSTVLINLAEQLMQTDGHTLICVDSKGDLVADLADRIPPARMDDVIVFDPADRERPVGFNLIGGSGESDLVVDHMVAELRTRYGAAGLGPRSEDILRSALTTLAARPGRYTLCEVEPLLTNAAFRQKQLLGGLDEPVLESFWAWYGSQSPAARAESIAPLANKLRAYTLRRRVRAVIGQTKGLDLAEALEGGKVVLISLAKGLIGADASALLGAAMVSRLWAAIQARAGLPTAKRRPATVICDEFADFAAISPVFSEAVSQSRGYGVSWVLAHQHLAQLDTTTRQAVLANCRTRLVMQTTAADAAAFAREFAPFLTAADLQSLGAYEGYAAVSTGAAVAPPASLRTRPAPPALGTAEAVRTASRNRYGVPPAEVDAAIRTRTLGSPQTSRVGEARRQS